MAPASDSLRAFPQLLRALTDFRLHAKRRLREARDAQERAHLGALQQAFKILINAFYGYLAFGRGHWNDFAAADRVTAEGRRIIALVLERLAGVGACALELDTDGVYFVPPPDGHTGARGAPARPGGRGAAGGNPAGAGRALCGDAQLQDEDLRPRRRARAPDPEGLRAPVARSGAVRAPADRGDRSPAPGRARPPTSRRWWTAGSTTSRPIASPSGCSRARRRFRTRSRCIGIACATGLRHPGAAYEVALASGRTLLPGDQITYYVAGRGSESAGRRVGETGQPLEAGAAGREHRLLSGEGARDLGSVSPFTEFEGLRPYVEPAASRHRRAGAARARSRAVSDADGVGTCSRLCSAPGFARTWSVGGVRGASSQARRGLRSH